MHNACVWRPQAKVPATASHWVVFRGAYVSSFEFQAELMVALLCFFIYLRTLMAFLFCDVATNTSAMVCYCTNLQTFSLKLNIKTRNSNEFLSCLKIDVDGVQSDEPCQRRFILCFNFDSRGGV